jgi:hypothetical protein
MRILLSLILSLLMSTTLAQEIAGVQIPDSVEVSGKKLVLNGAGLRKKFFAKVYAAGLYLPEPTSDANRVIELNEPKRILMQFIYDEVRAVKITRGWTEGFKNNSSADQMKALQSRLDDFNALFVDMQKGDRVVIDYVPGLGTRVEIKGKARGIIPGEDFMQALFRVWLGDRPADKGLKKGLLGGV